MYVRLAAVLGLTGVILGALGAHGPVHELIVANDPEAVMQGEILIASHRLDSWKTGVFYQITHALAILAVALALPVRRAAIWLWTGGVLIFSGSLFLLTLTNTTWLGAITPIGGLLLMGGWAWLIFAPSPKPPAQA